MSGGASSGGGVVSVVVPVWNTAEGVRKLIPELLGQSYRDLEVIAVDDGSSDSSLAVLEGFAKKDKRLKVIHQENAGVGAARNRGIEAATGEFLVFVDSDDEVEPRFIEVMVEAMRENPGAVLALTGKRYNKILDGKVVETYVERRRGRRKHERLSDYVIYLMILDGRMYSMTGRIFRAGIVRERGVRLEVGRDFAEDTKFTIDYLAAAERGSGGMASGERGASGLRGALAGSGSSRRAEVVFIPETLYVYNFGTETSMVRRSSTVWGNWERSYRDLEEWARSENRGRLGLRARILLGLVRLRWRGSWYKARRRMRRGVRMGRRV